jgi:hypothetical protein
VAAVRVALAQVVVLMAAVMLRLMETDLAQAQQTMAQAVVVQLTQLVTLAAQVAQEVLE